MSYMYVFHLSREIVSYKYINSHWLIGYSESLFPRLHQALRPQQFIQLLQDIGGQHVAEPSQKVWDFFIVIHIHVFL